MACEHFFAASSGIGHSTAHCTLPAWCAPLYLQQQQSMHACMHWSCTHFKEIVASVLNLLKRRFLRYAQEPAHVCVCVSWKQRVQQRRGGGGL